MSADAEFVIGLRKECGCEFTVYDSSSVPARSTRLRAALEQHRDDLRVRLQALERILEGESPERAAALMIDGTFARIERLVLRPDLQSGARPIALTLENLSRELSGR